MSENTYKPRNFRVVRHVTKNRILDIQDSLEIGKLRIELVEFVEGEGAKLAVEHYAEPDALALVCYDILQGRPWEKYRQPSSPSLARVAPEMGADESMSATTVTWPALRESTLRLSTRPTSTPR